MPIRIQRRRTKGSKMPTGAVYVGRGTPLGNPFVVGSPCGIFDGLEGRPLGLRDQVEILIPELDLPTVLKFYREMVEGFICPEMYPFGHNWQAEFRKRTQWNARDYIRSNLRGRDLACWCPLVDKDGQPVPCHADVLLELANS